MPADHRTNDLLRPQSPAVYRRRRLVAAVLLVVVVVLVVLLVGWVVSLFRPAPESEAGAPTPTATSEQGEGSGGDAEGSTTGETPAPDSSADSTADPSADSSAEESSDPSTDPSDAAAAGDCPAGDIVISAATDQPTYGEGEEPVLELRVDNTGEEPCQANLGTNQQVFTVYSGSDRIFSTRDCQVEGGDALVEISPDTQERARFTWPRVRSLPDCEVATGEPRSGTYRLEVSLGELEAQPVTFTLQ